MERSTSIFVEVFGDSPSIRILDFFLTFSGFDYSKSQVASEAGVSRITLEPIWQKFIQNGFIKKTRVIGRAEMYQLNKQNAKVKTLLELDLRLSKTAADEAAKEELLNKTTIRNSPG